MKEGGSDVLNNFVSHHIAKFKKFSYNSVTHGGADNAAVILSKGSDIL